MHCRAQWQLAMILRRAAGCCGEVWWPAWPYITANTHMGHNISHSLGSLARVHHGLATGLALEVSLPWLIARPEGAENYARAAQALGGPASAAALPGVFAKLMRAVDIPAELPSECDGVPADALAEEMKNAANHGMSQNAACQVEEADLDELARLVMRLPIASVA